MAWSPTQRVGHAPVSEFPKVERPVAMLSLDNTYNEDEICARSSTASSRASTATAATFSVEPKIDGFGIELTYKRGVLALGATRGDGRDRRGRHGEREDGAAASRCACASRCDIVVRGEIYMTKAEFAAINAERDAAGEELFKNPRNTAAGSIKQQDPREVAKRPMRTILYEVVDGERYATGHLASLEFIKRLGLPTSNTNNTSAASWDELHRAGPRWERPARQRCRTRSTASSSRSTTSR